MARSGIHFFLSLSKQEMRETSFIPEVLFSKDFPYAIDFWLAITKLSPGAFNVLAQVSRLFLEGLDSNFAWKERVEEALTGKPILRQNPPLSYKEFFQKKYEKLGLAALNKGLLDENTAENNNTLFEMLVKSVDDGLEQLAKRLINRLPASYFSAEKCITLFSCQGFYTNCNLEMVRILLNLIASFSSEIRYRILLQGFFSALRVEETNFGVAAPTVAAIIWQEIPKPMRQGFFIHEVPPWFDLISDKIPNQAVADKCRLMNALLLAHASAKFSNIQFLLDDMPSAEVRPTIKLALTIQYFVTQSEMTNFIIQTTNSIKTLLSVLPDTMQHDFVTSFYEVALVLFREGLGDFQGLALPPIVIAYLQHLGADTRLINAEKILARLLYGECWLAKDLTIIETRFARLLREMRAAPRRPDYLYLSFLFEILTHAIAGNLPLDVLAKFMENYHDTDFAARLLYRVIEAKFGVEAIQRYLRVLMMLELSQPICARFIEQTCEQQNEPLILNFSMDVFASAIKMAPDYPWQAALSACFRVCFRANDLYSFAFYLQHYSSYPFFIGAIKDFVDGERPRRKVKFFKQLFIGLEQKDISIKLDCWNLCIVFGMHHYVIKEFNRSLVMTPQTLCAMAVYDVKNKSNLTKTSLSLLCFDVAMLALALQSASNLSEMEVLPVLLKAMSNSVMPKLEVVLKHIIDVIILESKEKYLECLSKIFKHSDKKNQEMIIRWLLQTIFFCNRKIFDWDKLLHYLEVITGVSDKSNQLFGVVGYIYDLLSRSAKKRDGQFILTFAIPHSDRDEILLSLLRLAETNRNKRVVDNLFRCDIGKKFLTTDRINSFDKHLGDFIRESVDAMPVGVLEQLAFWQAKKVESDLQSAMLKSVNSAFHLIFNEYNEKPSDPRGALSRATNLTMELLAIQERFKASLNLEAEEAGEFDKFFYKLLYSYLQNIAEENNSKRFLALLTKHCQHFGFLHEKESADGNLYQIVIGRIKLVAAAKETQKANNLLTKSIQQEIFASYQNSKVVKIVENRK